MMLGTILGPVWLKKRKKAKIETEETGSVIGIMTETGVIGTEIGIEIATGIGTGSETEIEGTEEIETGIGNVIGIRGRITSKSLQKR